MVFKILYDTREKVGTFTFKSYDVEVSKKCLKTADYTIEGYEDKIAIDRKRNSGELQMCFGIQWTRFRKELVRLSTFDEAYIMCTFPYEDLECYPINSGIPEKKWKYLKTTGKYLRKKIHETEEEFPSIKFIFTYSNSEAEEQTYNLLKTYYDKQTNII